MDEELNLGHLGTFVGVLAAVSGGWVETLLMRLTDLMLSIPRLFLALMLVALYGPSLVTTVVVLAATTWMAAARLVRGEILSVRELEFVTAARAVGAPPFRLVTRHLLPAVVVPITVESSLRVGDTILLEAALSFLGLGVPAPAPTWGNLVADGRDSLLDAWWIATLPGLAIAATVIALNLLGDAARDRFDPLSRRSTSRFTSVQRASASPGPSFDVELHPEPEVAENVPAFELMGPQNPAATRSSRSVDRRERPRGG